MAFCVQQLVSDSWCFKLCLVVLVLTCDTNLAVSHSGGLSVELVATRGLVSQSVNAQCKKLCVNIDVLLPP